MVDGLVGIFRMYPLWLLAAGLFWYREYSSFNDNEYKPRMMEVDSNRNQIKKLDQELTTLQDKMQRVPELKKTIVDLSSQLDVRLSQLPRDFNVANILRQMNDLGKRSSLDFAEFKISPEASSDFYSKVTIQMALKGSFPQVLLFFDRLSKTNRIFNINNIEFSTNTKTKGASPDMSFVKAQATTFRFVEESGFSARGREIKK